MQFRNMINNIFGNKTPPQATTYYKTLNDFVPSFTPFSGALYDSDVCRTCIDTIARNAAKLKPRHIRRDIKDGKSITDVHDNLEWLLSVRPNIYMSAYDFLYKVVAQLYSCNNAFIYVQTDKGVVTGLYPINFSNITMVEYERELYCKFLFGTGFQMTVPYSDIIHLRRHFNRDDLFGEGGVQPFKPTLDLMRTVNQGIVNAIKSSARIRGILKFTGTLRPEDLKKQRDAFVSDYLSINNDGGIAATDTKAEFIPMDSKPQMADGDQMAVIRENTYRYFGINQKIIQSEYSESDWDSFYESVLEPIAIQLSLECTVKLFTNRELGFGNEIIFEANRLQYVSAKTKIQLIKELSPLGLLSVNEGREIFNLGPVENGDKRYVSLNYVDADKQNKYQLGEDDEPKGGEGDE